MAFLIPLISALAGVAGTIPAFESSGAAQKGADLQNLIAQQELNQKTSIANSLIPFFQQYMQQGNPFLNLLQQSQAGQNAQQFGNAAGQLRGQMQTSGLGYGPSGTTAAALGQLGQAGAQQSSSDYLKNLLASEQQKFNAAQGMQGVGNMFSGIAMPTNQLTQSSVGSSIGALGQGLAGLLGQSQQQPMATPTFGPTNPQNTAGGQALNSSLISQLPTPKGTNQ